MSDTQFELIPEQSREFALARRELLAAAGGVAVLLVSRPGEAQRGDGEPRTLDAWLQIGGDGTVTVYTGKVEVGQNIRTSLTQAVAEELPVPPESIRLVMGDTARVPYDRGTFGSRTTPTMLPILRRAGAAAREALVGLAAERWGVEAAGLSCADGRVHHAGSGRSATFAELAAGRELVRTIDDAPTREARDWTVAGRSHGKVAGAEFVTGRHTYASDVSRPEMLHGKILRPAGYGATLGALDAVAAEALPGVTVVRDGEFVGVTAPDPAVAAKAVALLDAEWQVPEQYGRAELFDRLRADAERGEAQVDGDLAAGRTAAEVVVESTYTIDFIAHVPLEPRAAVAEWDDGNLTVWTGTQRPFGVREELCRAFGLPDTRVRVLMPDTGSGYGGKHTGDAAVEAARLSRAVGRPVKVAWSREEEFGWAYFRPAGVIDVRAGATRDGRLTLWEHDIYNAGGAGLRTPYAVANQRHQAHGTRSPLRQGSYRALAATANLFGRETQMSRLAAELGLDPLELRLRNLTNDRLRAVFTAAAERFGWPGDLPEGHAAGIGGGTEKGGYVATCAEVTIDGGELRVVRAVTAFECGAVVNPRHLENQIEGSVVMALGGALFERIDFADGRILNGRMSTYRVPRFIDLPVLETVLVNRLDLPSAGAGETPMLGLAPAVAAAVAKLAGRWPAGLPMGV